MAPGTKPAIAAETAVAELPAPAFVSGVEAPDAFVGPYSKRYVVAAAFGLTIPVRFAWLLPTGEAPPVTAAGGGSSSAPTSLRPAAVRGLPSKSVVPLSGAS